MKLFLVTLLTISCTLANPTLRDVSCPDVGLLCLDSNAYTYCINLGIMKIVGSTVYSCPSGFVCDTSTTTPCVPKQKVAGKISNSILKDERAENLDDLVLQLSETTTTEPDEATTTAPEEATTTYAPQTTVRESFDKKESSFKSTAKKH